jgi:hypothetical protein
MLYFLTTKKGVTMKKMVMSAVGLAVLGAALKYGSKHPKWIEYQNNRKLNANNENKPAVPKPLESDVIELGHS